MKVGIFDSGLGGLLILKSFLARRKLNKYDYIFLGDTKNLPYGNKSEREVFRLALKGIDFLFKNDCELVIIACNTISAESLRRIQQKYLPKSKFINRHVLGVVRPTVETVSKKSKIVGVIGTNRTIESNAYLREFKKYHPKLQVYQRATPLLVPIIESGNLDKLDEVLDHYLKPLIRRNIDTLVLGCTHYGLVSDRIKKCLGNSVKLISQNEILPKKLESYLINHKKVEKKLSQNQTTKLFVTKQNRGYRNFKLIKL